MRTSTVTRLLPLALGALILTGCSGSWRKPPVEPIVKVETVKVPIDVPTLPDAIPDFQITEVPIILTNKSLPKLVKDADNGVVYQHVAITADLWAEIKRHWLDVKRYVKQSEAYFDDIEKQADENK